MKTETWYSVDLSSLITTEGVYSLRVSSISGNGADYSLKESSHLLVLEITLGETRHTSGTTQTTIRYTLQKHPGQAGQREESSLGLYFYNARWYNPQLARFLTADTLVPQPGSSQAYDRYAYANNNPVRYSDPSGHRAWDGCSIDGCEGNSDLITHTLYLGGFPFVLIPNEVQIYSQKAEEGFSKDEDKVSTGIGVAGIMIDDLEQGLIYRRNHAPNDVEAFISFNELENGSISITSLIVWNKTDTTINVDKIATNSFFTGDYPIIGSNEGSYFLNPPKIATKGYRGVGTSSPSSRSIINLLQSSSNNPNNEFSQNHHIDIVARFSAYDFDYTFLSTELISFDW